jgi:hypothetical protein
MQWGLSYWGVGKTTEVNISEDNQTDVISALEITNTGNVPINISVMWLVSPGSGVSMKWSATNVAPNQLVSNIAVSPSSTKIITSLAPSATEEIWLWMDFDEVEEQSSNQDVRFTSSY